MAPISWSTEHRWTIRANISLPNSSVPNKVLYPGFENVLDKFCLITTGKNLQILWKLLKIDYKGQ